ncbi:MAG: hypothetical protein JST82_09535 [Bacteroidetes bacterium]|nr:hypothetical protein [Bacteroidota bacterium]
MNSIRRYANPLFILLIILENFFLFYTHKQEYPFKLGQTQNATAYFLVSLSIGLLLIIRFYNQHIEEVVSEKKKTNYILPILFSAPLIYIAYKLTPLFTQYPLDAKFSDIIPLIQLMVKRFLTGVPVYVDPINDFGYNIAPTYLPLHWLPFSISELGHFDYRWMAFIIWSLCVIYIIARTVKHPVTAYKLIVPVLLYWLFKVIYQEEYMLMAYTIEMLIAGYYMFLIAGLNHKNIYITAIAITLCLMSRYSLVLWLPLWAFIYFISGHRKEVLKIIATVIVLIIIVYVIPFLSKDWGSFFRGYKYYDKAAFGEWTHLDDKGFPYQLYNGTGFAHKFYDKLKHLDIAQRIKVAQQVHLFISLGICLVMGIWYWFNRKRIDYKIFATASFKIYFCFFLAFIQVPYIYLMVVSSFVSITMYAEQLRYRTSPIQNN